MINDIHALCKIYAKKNAEIAKLSKMLDFLTDNMPCPFLKCSYKEPLPTCQKCIRQWLENQIEE